MFELIPAGEPVALAALDSLMLRLQSQGGNNENRDEEGAKRTED